MVVEREEEGGLVVEVVAVAGLWSAVVAVAAELEAAHDWAEQLGVAQLGEVVVAG